MSFFLPLLLAASIHEPDPAPPPPSDLTMHGGVAMTGSFAPAGGFWFGGTGELAVRYREIAEFRVDGGLGFLLPSTSTPDTCGEPPCFDGARVLILPTLGPRLALGGQGDRRVALTPFVGWVAVGQAVQDGPRTPAFDLHAPGGWTTFAYGARLSYGVAELRTTVFAARGDVRQPTIDIALGIAF